MLPSAPAGLLISFALCAIGEHYPALGARDGTVLTEQAASYIVQLFAAPFYLLRVGDDLLLFHVIATVSLKSVPDMLSVSACRIVGLQAGQRLLVNHLSVDV